MEFENKKQGNSCTPDGNSTRQQHHLSTNSFSAALRHFALGFAFSAAAIGVTSAQEPATRPANKGTADSNQKESITDQRNPDLASDTAGIAKTAQESPFCSPSSLITTIDYGGTKIVPLDTATFFAELLKENDGIAIADGEHLALLFTSLAKDLPAMKKAGLATVYIEAGRDNQANVEKFLETGDKAYLNHFTDDNPSGPSVRVEWCGIPITFLTACRDNGLHIICHDISDAQHAEELDTIPLSLAGDEQKMLKALKARIQQVGEEQANKEAAQFYERRRQHNEDWMNVFTEAQCATGGKFLFIGGEGHFNNNIGENSDRRDIDEQIAACGYKAPYINIKLHDGYEPYIEKPTTQRKGENDLPDYRVLYNKQQFEVIPNWSHKLVQSQLESGKLDYPQYQDRLAMFAEHHEKLLAGINAVEKILVVPESDAWQKLPEDHPMKSSEHVENAQQLFKKLIPLKTALVEGKAYYDQAQKVFEELRVQSQRYRADAEKLKTYYEDHISANPQSRFDRPIFDHLSLVIAANKALKDAEISNWFLASYKLDFDNQKKANPKGSSTMP